MDIYLDKLELQGFKSFPDKTKIKLHKGLTAIVGPNGCGKSNLVDALLWVLGEQRIKNLRGENNEDLIFSGSSSKKALGMAEVKAVFFNHNEKIDIARRFFRTGDAKYILKDKQCRNKDIQDALFEINLGAKKYFIFEQGSIDKLISLKPSEKRMLIEEAAEISQYLERKKETTSKLIIAEQNLENVDILITDKQNRLRELRNQVNYVERYRKAKQNKVILLKSLLFRKFNIFRGDLEKLKADMAEAVSKETSYIQSISILEKELIKLEENRWHLDKSLKNQQQLFFDTNREILSARGEIEKLEQENRFINQKITQSKELIQSGSKDIEDIDVKIAQIIQQVDGMEKDLQKEKSAMSDWEKQKNLLSEKLSTIQNQEAVLKKEFFRLQSEISRQNNLISDIEKKIGRIDSDVESKKSFIVELKSQITGEDLEKVQNDLSEAQKSYQTHHETLKKFELSLAEKNKKLAELTAQKGNLIQEIDILNNQKKKYLEIKEKIVGTQGSTPSDSHQGFLQDMIQTKKEYHTLLENFYHEEMDAIIPKKIEDIPHIDASKILINVKQPAEIHPSTTKKKGFVCNIKDIFSVDKPEVASFLKNGILVDNLQNAINLFKENPIDIITQDGYIFTRGGIIFRNREKGILDIVDEIRQIDNQIPQYQKDTEKIQKELDRKQDEMSTLTDSHQEQLANVQSLEEKVIHLKTRLETIQASRDKNLKRVELNESEIQVLLEEKTTFENRREELMEEKAALESQLTQTSSQREKIGDQTKNEEEKINDLEKEALQKKHAVNLIREKINSHQNQKKNQQNTKDRLENAIQQNQQSIGELEKRQEEIKADIKRLEEVSKGASGKKEDMDDRIKSQEKEFGELNQKIKGKNDILSRQRKELEEIKEKKNKAELNLASINKDMYQLEDLSFRELNTELKNIPQEDSHPDLSTESIERQLQEHDEKLYRMRDSNKLNFSAESEFEILDKEHGFLNHQRDDIINSIQDMNDAIQRIDNESKTSFNIAFEKIQKNFQKNFQILFEGGEAELYLSDPTENVLESGLEIRAQPPGKRLQNLRLLSGGEKTLTSLAFLFSLFEYKPSPFCVFDEVDASLDEANIQKFLKFVHKLKENTQFLMITHNFKTMEEADYLYGVSMDEPGISTIYSLKMTGKDRFEPAPLE